MKTFVLFRKNTSFFALLFAIALTLSSNAQTTGEFIFNNPSLVSGSAGNDGAVYRFPAVATNMDALLTIKGRSSATVNLNNIDLPNGQPKAFQPQVRYGTGNVSGAITWWLEFEVVFVTANTSNPVALNNFDVTALDIDGNNDKLREVNSFYSPGVYTLENPTNLAVSNLMVSGSAVGKSFTGTLVDHPGIDTSATDLMTSMTFYSSSSIKFRVGGTTTGSTGNANRMHSIWFKEFTFNNPVTLPIQLASFTAILNSNSKVDLKWTTTSEINVSHFAVEKSFDGINFSEAGLVFAYGSANDNTNYSFADNLGNTSATVIYYRLRSVDMDGKTEYSETRMIRISKGKENTISILAFPNPVMSELRITIPATWQNKAVTYQVYSISGQVLNSKQTGNSSQTETINVSKLARGMYIVKASCGSETAQERIVKQ